MLKRERRRDIKKKDDKLTAKKHRRRRDRVRAVWLVVIVFVEALMFDRSRVRASGPLSYC